MLNPDKNSVASVSARSILALMILGHTAGAQFIRLGPFLFDSQTELDLTYTTNVEQERPSDATAEREDYYLTWSLELSSSVDVMPQTVLDLKTGLAVEKHFIREDLDNSDAPFGLFNLTFESDWNPFIVYGGILYERTSESVDDIFVPSGYSTKGRQVGDTAEYFLGIDILKHFYEMGVSYELTRERFDSSAFEDEETDETVTTFYIQLLPSGLLSPSYERERTVTEYVNKPEANTDELRETIDLDVDLVFMERPEVTYSVGVTREYEEGETDGWELIHTLDVRESASLGDSADLELYLTYEYTDDPDEDDIIVEYGLLIDQVLSPRASHSFSVSRTPVDTFGSTEDTDELEFAYDFQRTDLFIYNLDFGYGVTYTISDPVEGSTEKTWEYTVDLIHSVNLNSRLTREISYEYTRESSNVEDEVLDEHLVEWSYVYTF